MTTVAIIAIAAVVIAVYALVDPVGRGFAPHCLLKTLTGYDCPGCGFQRALTAMLHGDVAAAWHYNPFVFFALPVGALYVVVEACPGRYGRLRRYMLSVPAAVVLLAAILTWWVVRNLP